MLHLSSGTFRPPLPHVPLPKPVQWLFRLILILFTMTAFSMTILLVPLSVYLDTALLALHPHNRPPHCSRWQACKRGWWVYLASGFLWGITGIGTPPDHGIEVSRWLANRGVRRCEQVAKETGSVGNEGRPEITEDSINPLARDLCIGALGNGNLVRKPITEFWLDSIDTSASSRHTRARPPKAILWLAGGGYVTGYPLNDRPIFSLARTLPLGEHTILAPSISRALSVERSFPIPLLDALAAYAHLRKKGYEEEDITVIGNSAGGGLAWSLGNLEKLGVPKRAIMISLWIKLPPMTAAAYPDFVNTPQLANAARCYLARYPHRTDRSGSFDVQRVVSKSRTWLANLVKHILSRINGDISALKSPIGPPSEKTEDSLDSLIEEMSKEDHPQNHLDWFNESSFIKLSSHHPLISPSTDLLSPFVRHTLGLLAARGTRILVHCGTAEWFYRSIVDLSDAAKKAGMDVTLVENVGGLHSEACLSWPEQGGAAAILQQSILTCLHDPVKHTGISDKAE